MVVALTPEQVAESLQLSKATIYRKIKTGEIPAKKIGKEFRISPVYLHYFVTGQDYDIYQMEKADWSVQEPYMQLLAQVRKGQNS